MTLCLMLSAFLLFNGPVSQAEENSESEALLKSICFNSTHIAITEGEESGVTEKEETIINDDLSSTIKRTYYFNNKDLFVYHVYPTGAETFPILTEYSSGATCKIDGVKYDAEEPDKAPTFNPEDKGWNIVEITSKNGKVNNVYYFLHIGQVRRWRNMQFAYWNFIPEPASVTISDKPVLEVIKEEFEKQVQSKWPDDYEVNSEDITKKINDDLSKIAELEKAEADKAAADEFAKMVAELKGDGTDSEEAIAAAKKAYDALSPEAKELAKADNEKLAVAEKAVADKKVAEEASKATTETPKTTTPAVKKGTAFKVGKNRYKVTKLTKKTGTVTFTKPVKKTNKAISIPATVKYKGYTFKVTAIAKNACKNNKKLTAVTVGKNVTSIGAYAFAGDAKLKKIAVKSAVLKKVGAKALKGIHKKAVIKVPKKQLKKYAKLFKGKGQKKTVKVKK